MSHDLLTSVELADLLRVPSAKTAERVAIEHGVRPIDLGRGRGRGKRWRWVEVEEALLAARERRPSPVIGRPSRRGILHRTNAEILAELETAPPHKLTPPRRRLKLVKCPSNTARTAA